jgi:hypothetical protein
VDVHEDDVGGERLAEAYGFETVGGLTDDFNVGLVIK